MDYYKVGNCITLLRKEKGLTGEKLAEILGVSAQAVSKWENGKCLPEAALLPTLATALGTSIDALLMPRELIILKADYTDGVNSVDVTQVMNHHVSGNSLNITVNQQFLGSSFESPRIKVLLIKYQTPQGIFFDYALENAVICLELNTMKTKPDTELKLLDAYYGNRKDYRLAMNKMQHYAYFHWNEIRVNHESFPSSAASDDSEYLLLIYSNDKGIHAISCEEGETLIYSKDRKSIEQKDSSFCSLPGIMNLEWEKGMDCTWAGAAYAALNYMGEPYSYEQIMGMSGACYRLAFTPVWDFSATDALVAFDYSSQLFKAIGYEQIWACRLEKEERTSERARIMMDIQNGKPILAINLRIAPEWGLITGYKDQGRTLLCRTYFDMEILNTIPNKTEEYLESDFWPFLITHFGQRTEKPSEYDTLLASVKTMILSYEASCERGYYQGKQAYEKWMEGLRDDSLWGSHNSKEDIDRRLAVNDAMLLNLIDARRCAYCYLKEGLVDADGSIKEILVKCSDYYQQIYEKLNNFRTKLLSSRGRELKYNEIVTKCDPSSLLRNEQVSLLEEVKSLEEVIAENLRVIIKE